MPPIVNRVPRRAFACRWAGFPGLRDFRWREYLHANPDVAANGADEAHAFAHFVQQGYYERRIFDPARLHGFDGGYYRTRYPELGLRTDAEAQCITATRGGTRGVSPTR